ncbi:ISWI chromatin-remodeling complex ATPase ISW2 [Coccidioides immitis RMSCC 2394]|uniref:ISWI chromatin-remodeling complex ATPase ISW2 n=1 Tax=Coccidioides immitis RMSCC 2394 TaxID=404692 RepID=A0A0J6Y7P3_COCIT|nr:ISWI chromatin-remodeling complex ATPase ISW2 [Coccidioides immitis RMSCC 2394]
MGFVMEKNPLENKDPFDWSIDEVVAYLCRASFDSWSHSKVPPPRPAPEILEKALRENDVTGYVLLTEINKQTLSEEFGLKSLGQRATIVRAVKYLQGTSPKYNEYVGQLSSADIIPDPHASSGNPTQLCPSKYDQQTPSVARPTTHPQRHSLPAAPSTLTSLQPSTSVFVEASTNNAENALFQPVSYEVADHIPISKESHPPSRSKVRSLSTLNDSEANTRHDEHYIIDKNGRKRRKLNLSALTTQQSEPQQLQRRYLDHRKMSISGVFYPDNTINEDESGEDTFCIMAPDSLPTGHRLFVNQKMQYYLRQRPQYLKTKTGKPAIAVFPYRGSSAVQGDSQFFSLFVKNGKKVNVTRENMFDWPEFDLGSDRLHYLLAKYPPRGEQDALPAYGDSASEGDYDSETWNEIQEEIEQKKDSSKRSTDLSPAAVDAIIDVCIADYISKWHLKKRPIEERKARRLWRRARAKRTRLAGIKAASSEIAHLDHRLKEIRKAIKMSPWSQAKDVQLQCQAMEQTVFQREFQKWTITVLETEKCPPKIASNSKASRPRPPRHIQLPDDEESLGSDTEDSGNDTDDFVVPDDEPPGHGQRPADALLSSSPCPTIEPSDDQDTVSPRKQVRFRGDGRGHAGNTVAGRVEGSSSLPSSRNLVGVEIVDLTRSDNENGSNIKTSRERIAIHVRTPPMSSHRRDASSSRLLDDSEGSTSASISSTASTLVADLDLDHIMSLTTEQLQLHRTHLMAWYAHYMGEEDRIGLTRIFNTKSFRYLKSIVYKGLQNLLEHRTTIPGTSAKDSKLYLRMTVMYISWIVRRKIIAEKGIKKQDIEHSMRKKKTRHFLSLVADILRTYPFKKSKGQEEKDSSTEASAEMKTNLDDEPDGSPRDEDGLPNSTHTPHRKRKRAVKQSQEALDTQKSAQRRVKLQEQQQQRLLQRLGSSGVANSDPERQAVSFDEPVIYLDPHIGRLVKPHQLHGMQFMWRELIKDDKRQGCLLAHTMGLGKTMQVISFLVTIAKAANSPDPEIRKQIPDCFRESRTLILCPPSLIENWSEEFMRWLPQDPATKRSLGPVRKVLSNIQSRERLQEIAAWYTEGGILLISYDIFRSLVHNASTKRRPRPLEPNQHESVKKQLLNGPNIIIADEAHKMKNRTTGIAAAACGFKSKSRIALTGSPLANHLEEYYAMINWIAPGYLGDFVQFKAKYIEPIEAGLYVDSTRAERRESLKKLQVLKKDLDPKINRADISVLAGDLPPKVEFVITVPLTALQEEAYKLYVETLMDTGDDVASTRVWAWLAILSLLCNHPSCFMEKLLGKNIDKRAKALIQDSEYESFPEDTPATQDSSPEDTPVTQVLAPETISKLKRVFDGINDLKSTAHSHRAAMLDQIIKQSVNAGDKVLIFSHSIPTLNYIEDVLKVNRWRYCRLDGTTPITSRQSATKSFNKIDSPMQVYLISTKAGGLGLNIPGANRVVIFDFAFNPTWEEQAVGRAYRFGQRKPVFVYRFIAGGTYEDIMYNKTVFKTQLSFRVVDKKNPIRYATRSKKAYLFPPKEVKQQSLTEFIGKDPKVLDKILEQPNFVRKITLTETFQREDNDNLTPEEEQAVQAEVDDERLKRNDPAAWARKQSERLRQAEATLPMEQPYMFNNNAPSSQLPPRMTIQRPIMLSMGFSGPAPRPPSGYVNPNILFTAPSSSAPQYGPPNPGSGPPPLQPDTSLFATPSSQPPNSRLATFTSLSTNFPIPVRHSASPRSPTNTTPVPPDANLSNPVHQNPLISPTSAPSTAPPTPSVANIPGSNLPNPLIHPAGASKVATLPLSTASIANSSHSNAPQLMRPPVNEPNAQTRTSTLASTNEASTESRPPANFAAATSNVPVTPNQPPSKAATFAKTSTLLRPANRPAVTPTTQSASNTSTSSMPGIPSKPTNPSTDSPSMPALSCSQSPINVGISAKPIAHPAKPPNTPATTSTQSPSNVATPTRANAPLESSTDSPANLRNAPAATPSNDPDFAKSDVPSNPSSHSPKKSRPVGFDGADERERESGDDSDLVDNSPKTPTMEEESTRCATQ